VNANAMTAGCHSSK